MQSSEEEKDMRDEFFYILNGTAMMHRYLVRCYNSSGLLWIYNSALTCRSHYAAVFLSCLYTEHPQMIENGISPAHWLRPLLARFMYIITMFDRNPRDLPVLRIGFQG